MFSCFKPANLEKQKSKEIDIMIKEWNKEYSDIVKLLLLGTGEAGKTTIMKQMKILHINGFSESEKHEKIIDIRQNIHESIYDIVRHMALIEPPIPFQYEKSENSAKFVIEIGENLPNDYSNEYFDHVIQLWNDLGVKECYKRSNEYQLIDCARYFLDKVDEIRQKNYLPSEQDILHCRKKTTVINNVEFSVRVPKYYGGGNQKFSMFDVGGQRSERNKWIHVITGVHAVLFLIATNDFDQKLREDSEINRLHESLSLFEKIWTNKFLIKSGFIIFLNKQDLLKEKIDSGKSIGKYFPEYDEFRISEKEGNPFDEFDRTRQFIKHKIKTITERRRTITRVLAGRSILEEDMGSRECFFHFTTATDTNNIKRVFDDVHTMILDKNLVSAGLY